MGTKEESEKNAREVGRTTQITEEVVDRVEKILKLMNISKTSSSPLPEEKQEDWNLRFMAQMQATSLIREGGGGVFGHLLIREYCLTGKLPKNCFEGFQTSCV